MTQTLFKDSKVMLYSDTDTKPVKVLLAELGQRLEQYRLSRNLRQEDVAQAAGISRMTVSKMERGGGNIETLVRLLRALGLGDRILDVVPDARISPMDAKSATGENRQRARPAVEETADKPWTWSD